MLLTPRVSQDYLHPDSTFPLPARSPNLSPIEHIWDPLEWQVGQPSSLVKFLARFQQLWKETESYGICMHQRPTVSHHTVMLEVTPTGSKNYIRF
ncbi:hypothetical protein TNCV_389991 [Trichonephila clavipes]|nr:hypothetical protein TNCV_389991 [Trichonephila clavipes]